MTTPEDKVPTEEPKTDHDILAEIKETVEETQAVIDTLREELDEAFKGYTKQLAEIAAFQKVLEKNQQTIYHEGIGGILTKIDKLAEAAEIQLNDTGTQEP